MIKLGKCFPKKKLQMKKIKIALIFLLTIVCTVNLFSQIDGSTSVVGTEL